MMDWQPYEDTVFRGIGDLVPELEDGTPADQVDEGDTERLARLRIEEMGDGGGGGDGDGMPANLRELRDLGEEMEGTEAVKEFREFGEMLDMGEDAIRARERAGDEGVDRDL